MGKTLHCIQKGGNITKLLYTVKEVSDLSGVTIKTLHHYHRIGLLMPGKVSEAGYRLYGPTELERLQEILVYRELELPLEQIKQMMNQHADRLSVLSQQEELLAARRQRLDTILHTLRQSIAAMKEGTPMDDKALFKGFGSEDEWNRALSGQNQHLAETYGMEPLQVGEAEVQGMNEQAREAMAFMNGMADFLRDGVKHHDAQVGEWIRAHLEFLHRHGHPAAPKEFAAQTQFFLNDDFHLGMLEAQQTGLSYYLHAAAQAYAAANS